MTISKLSIWSIITFGYYTSRSPRPISDIPRLPTNYSNYYLSQIKPFAEEFEQKRKKVLIYAGIIFWVTAITIGIMYWVNILQYYALFLIIIAQQLISYTIYKTYKNAAYTNVLSKIISFYGDFSFTLKPNITARNYDASRIIPCYDNESAQNHIIGQYKGIELEQFYTNLTRRIDNNKHVTVFKGLILKLKLKKNFKGITLIKKDLGLFNILNKESNLERVRLEDPIFESEFEVFSSDQIEARYLLTTIFMERLINFKKAMATKHLTISFYEQHMLMLIAKSRPLFSTASITEPADFTTDSSLLLPEMAELLEIIDGLKLCREIGL